MKIILCLLAIYLQEIITEQQFCKIRWCDKEYECKGMFSTNIACQHRGNCDLFYLDNCKFNPMENLKYEIVNVHNMYRNQYATGTSRRPTVKIANMMALKWDEGLAFLAQCSLKPCNSFLTTCSIFPPKFPTVGQNIAKLSSSTLKKHFVGPCLDISPIEYINVWYNEMNDITFEEIKEKMESYTKNKLKSVERFAQMTWATNTHVGCALREEDPVGDIIYCTLLCNYGPGEVEVGAEWGQEGEPASKCPRYTTRDYRYPGLCSSIQLIKEPKGKEETEEAEGKKVEKSSKKGRRKETKEEEKKTEKKKEKKGEKKKGKKASKNGSGKCKNSATILLILYVVRVGASKYVS